jgi:hypothetical protein
MIFWKENNSTLLKRCISLAAMILCFGAIHRPSNGAIHPIRSKPIPQHLWSLGSPSSARDVGNASSDSAARFGSCATVPYGNQTFEQEMDPKELPLNELMLFLDHPAYVSSPNPAGPVIVDIGLYVHGISDLDPGANTFAMEGYLDLIWCDARTKFNSTSAGKDVHIYLENDAEKELEEIWWPAVTFVNEAKRRVVENQKLLITADGTVEYREKFYVTLSSSYDMKRFPFDEQILVAEIESFAWSSDHLQFHIEDDLVGFSED